MVMIDICLATYNGEKYICEQIDSILSQTYSNWHLYIRDDGSTDKTVNILNKYYLSHPEKITIISDDKGNLGVNRNFFEIFKHTTSDYIAFSDQDDIWLPQKLSKLYIELVKLGKYGVVHSNYEYIKEGLTIHKGRKYNKKLQFNRSFFRIIFSQCSFVGCTIMVNRNLLELIKIWDDSHIGHDHLFLAYNSLFGDYQYIPEKLVLHRIHEKNSGSAGKKNNIYYLKKYLTFKRASLNKQVLLAEKILNESNIPLKNSDNHLLNSFVLLCKTTFIKKLVFYFKANLFDFSLLGLNNLLRLLALGR